MYYAGNPGELRDWLLSVKQLQREQEAAPRNSPLHDVTLIEHHERYADLRHYVFHPKAGPAASPTSEPDWPPIDTVHPALPGAQARAPGTARPTEAAVAAAAAAAADWSGAGQLQRMHPAAGVISGQLPASGIHQLSFEPLDCLQLYDAMCQEAAAAAGPIADTPDGAPALPAALERLAPEVYFARAAARRLPRATVREYEAELKTELVAWTDEGAGKGVGGMAEKVLERLATTFEAPKEHSEMSRSGMDFVHLMISLSKQVD